MAQVTEEQQAGAGGGAEGSLAGRKPSKRDVQRDALRDLVRLATQCATTESEIEQRHRGTKEEIEKEVVAARRELENKLRVTRERLEQEKTDRLGKVEARYQQEAGALRAADENARQRISMDYQATERDLKAKYEQATWLAESLFEGTEAQLREDAKKAKDALEKQNEELDEAEKNAKDVIRRYRQSVPAVEAGGAGEGENTPYSVLKERVDAQLHALGALGVPHWFTGVRPYLTVIALVVGAVVAFQIANTVLKDQTKALMYGVGGVTLFGAVFGAILYFVSKTQIRKVYAPFVQSVAAARAAAEREHEEAARERKKRHTEAVARREEDVRGSKEKFSPVMDKAKQARDAALAARKSDVDAKLPQLEAQRQALRGEVETWYQRKQGELKQWHETESVGIENRYKQRLAENDRQHVEARAALEKRLREGLAHIHAPMEDGNGDGRGAMPWESPAWTGWKPSKHFAAQVPFGSMHVDLRKIAEDVPTSCPLQLALPGAFSVPATLDFPRQASLLIQHDREGRELAIRTIQMVMTRLLTTLPAGRVRFTIIDPVGLGQNFAGFMHLADHDEALVGSRIWTEREQIAQRLSDLTEHMETVIQKYLRNEFETIDDYNAQAGELAEPYRFLVIADLPVNFEEDSLRRLAAIASSGARCGIYVLVAHDVRQPLPPGTHIEELQASSVTLEVRTGMRDEGGGMNAVSAHPSSLGPHPSLHWKDEVFGQFPLAVTPPPSEEFLTRVLDVVGRGAKEANRVEVSFDAIAPKQGEYWTASATDELKVPIGRMGATRLQLLRLGRGVAQHALIAGKTGSGKSTLLHAMVTNLAMWYSPDEVEFYLIDFKKGVEFKTYATHQLPHARAIAVESDREFGLSVLQRLDAELVRRGDLYRKAGVQDLAAYRATGGVMPRTLLMIDEFQEFFSEDDKLAQDASLLLDRLVRQGRAFGIHVLLGSQTIGGSSGLPRSTIGQMAIRIALQTSEADSHLILGDNNAAARLLSRPGEAIYNDQGGLMEANSPFQVAWLPDEKREQYLQTVQALSRSKTKAEDSKMPLVVFEGNAPADITKNVRLAQLLESSSYPPTVPAAHCWLGDPVAIKDPTAIVLRRQAGANALIIGQQDEAAMALMASSLISLSAQHAPASAKFYLLDGTAADSPLAPVFPRVMSALPHWFKNVEYRAVPEAIAEIAEEMRKRQGGEESDPASIYLFVYGLQRYRALRKSEDSFSFSSSDDEKKPQPDKQFAEILREGPALGIHTIVWADTAATLERTLDRSAMREFDHRVLFQMSASDSSNLIDSPAANKLGQNRALAYSEEQGVMEKFRPYALPPQAWLARVFGQTA